MKLYVYRLTRTSPSVADIQFIFIFVLTRFFSYSFNLHCHNTAVIDIPHILTHLEVEEKLETSINIHPSQKVLNSAFFDIMKFLNWTKCAIIYDQNDGEWAVIWFSCWKHLIEDIFFLLLKLIVNHNSLLFSAWILYIYHNLSCNFTFLRFFSVQV